MKQIEVHPLAKLFPDMTAEEFHELGVHIEEHGQQHPIILYQGKILDGRHRYKACQRIGIKPLFEVYRGDDPLGLVVGCNLHRRNLSTSQRAMLAARIADLQQGDAGRQSANLRSGKSETKEIEQATHAAAAKTVNVSERIVDSASKILDEAPAKIIAAVDKGEMTINAATEVIKQKQKDKEAVVDVFNKAIPDPLHAIWNRRGEIVELMKSVAKIMNTINDSRKADDAIFAGANFSDAALDLGQAHTRLRAMQLYCLCPYCQGRAREKCTFCGKRGFVSKDQYALVPTELRAMNEKGAK